MAIVRFTASKITQLADYKRGLIQAGAQLPLFGYLIGALSGVVVKFSRYSIASIRGYTYSANDSAKPEFV